MNIVTDASGLIVMMSDDGKPTPPPGGALTTLTNGQIDLLRAAQQTPNSGITFSGGVFTARPLVVVPAIDWSNSDNLDKVLKAMLLAAAAMSGKTVAQAKQAFLTAWQSLP